MLYLDETFYQRKNVIQIARELLGTELVVTVDGNQKTGLIVETEAYNGVTDRASHAFGGRRTRRTETMFLPGGHAYVYLCYGVHHLFNVVTSTQNDPRAVLIRAVATPDDRTNEHPGSGPGKLTKYLGIDKTFNASSLVSGSVKIRRSAEINTDEIGVGPRIGVEYAGEDALLPYRFVWLHHPALSGSVAVNRKVVPFHEIVLPNQHD